MTVIVFSSPGAIRQRSFHLARSQPLLGPWLADHLRYCHGTRPSGGGREDCDRESSVALIVICTNPQGGMLGLNGVWRAHRAPKKNCTPTHLAWMMIFTLR